MIHDDITRDDDARAKEAKIIKFADTLEIIASFCSLKWTIHLSIIMTQEAHPSRREKQRFLTFSFAVASYLVFPPLPMSRSYAATPFQWILFGFE
jgi:hypothetical protein